MDKKKVLEIIGMEKGQEKKVESLKKMLHELYRLDQFDIHDKIISFHNLLKKKYPNYYQYRLYHLISLSTHQEPHLFDFPGEDSIESFIQREYNQAISK